MSFQSLSSFLFFLSPREGEGEDKTELKLISYALLYTTENSQEKQWIRNLLAPSKATDSGGEHSDSFSPWESVLKQAELKINKTEVKEHIEEWKSFHFQRSQNWMKFTSA